MMTPWCKDHMTLAKNHTLFYNKYGVFLLSLSMLRKKSFSAWKYAKNMLAYRKGMPYCFVQQTTALHEHGSKCCSMEIFNELTCQKHTNRFEACCIFSQKLLSVVESSWKFFIFSLSFAWLNVHVLSNLRMLKLNPRPGLCSAYA